MLHGWRFRMPLWIAVAIAAALYVVRAAMRGFDFRPDMPVDAVVLVLFVIVLGLVAFVRRRFVGADDASDDAALGDGSQDSPRDC